MFRLGFNNFYCWIEGTSCVGSLIFDDVVVRNYLSQPLFRPGLTDCALVNVSRSRIEWVGDWVVTRTNLMINDSSIQSFSPSFLFGPALRLIDSQLSLSRSTVIGSSGSVNYPNTQSPAIYTCGSRITIGGGCRLEAGRQANGSLGLYSVIVHDCTNQPANLLSTIAVDLASTVAIGGWSGSFGLTYQLGPQTGLAYATTATTLDVDQYTHAGALSVLAIGAVTTTPWTNLVGPVFVDPVGITDYWDIAPTTAVLRRSFAIPPGLPLGTSVAMQAFELLPNGQFLTSNATIAGIW